jgi:hypothetical protein
VCISENLMECRQPDIVPAASACCSPDPDMLSVELRDATYIGSSIGDYAMYEWYKRNGGAAMIELRAGTIVFSIGENGKDISIHDELRGSHWILDSATCVWAKAGESGNTAFESLVPTKATKTGAGSATVTYIAGGVEIDFLYSVTEDYIGVQLPAEIHSDVGSVSLPGSFTSSDTRTRFLLPIMQGMLWDGRGDAFETVRRDGEHTGFSMAMYGCLADRGGLLVTAETSSDTRWWFGKAQDGRCWCSNVQIGSLGSIRYQRSVRIYLTGPRIADVAKRYRERVIERGRFKSWKEKVEERPSLERLFGTLMCFVGYCQDDLDYAAECRKLKAFGFDRALVYPGRFNTYHQDFEMGGKPPINMPRDTIAEIRELGFDVAPWSWLNEALDDGSDAIRSIYRRNSAGEQKPMWVIEKQQWYEVCSSAVQDFQRKAIAGSMSDMSWDHFDVMTCAHNNECYALDHSGHSGRPLSREEDREFIRNFMRETQLADRAVSSESFNDAYSVEYDLGSVKAWPQYGPWPFWPVPLTMLVFHDSMIHSWWEPHNYNAVAFGRMPDGHFQYGGGQARIMACLDALMGCPPDVFPFGSQYGWTGKDRETFLYSFRFEDPVVQHALQLALPVAQLHRRIGRCELTDFNILSEDGYVQQSEFSDGTRIVANFSNTVKDAGAGIGPVQVYSWRETD